MPLSPNPLDREIRSRLDGAELPADPAIWEGVAAHLDDKRRQRLAAWWWIGAPVALLLSAGLYFTVLPDSTSPVQAAHVERMETPDPQNSAGYAPPSPQALAKTVIEGQIDEDKTVHTQEAIDKAELGNSGNVQLTHVTAPLDRGIVGSQTIFPKKLKAQFAGDSLVESAEPTSAIVSRNKTTTVQVLAKAEVDAIRPMLIDHTILPNRKLPPLSPATSPLKLQAVPTTSSLASADWHKYVSFSYGYRPMKVKTSDSNFSLIPISQSGDFTNSIERSSSLLADENIDRFAWHTLALQYRLEHRRGWTLAAGLTYEHSTLGASRSSSVGVVDFMDVSLLGGYTAGKQLQAHIAAGPSLVWLNSRSTANDIFKLQARATAGVSMGLSQRLRVGIDLQLTPRYLTPLIGIHYKL